MESIKAKEEVASDEKPEKKETVSSETHSSENSSESYEWFFAFPAQMDKISGGRLVILDELQQNENDSKIYKAKALYSEEPLYVKKKSDNAIHSSEISAIPYTLREKGWFIKNNTEYLVFDAFDGNFSELLSKKQFSDLDNDGRISLVCGVVLRQLLAARMLLHRSSFNFDFKPSNVLYRLLPDGRIDIRLIDMTESIISGDPEIVEGLHLFPIASDYYIAPAFYYFFTHLQERASLSDEDEKRMQTAKTVIHLCDIYTLGLELYHFLSEGDYLLDINFPKEQYRDYYHDKEGSFSVSEEALTLVDNQEERTEMAYLINYMISWRENTPAYEFCDNVINKLITILEGYNQLPQDIVIPANYLTKYNKINGTDIVIKISNSVLVDGKEKNDWIEYQTVLLREKDVCEVMLPVYNCNPGKGNNYRYSLNGRVFLHAYMNEIKCRIDGEWMEFNPGDSILINTKSSYHSITIERLIMS